MVPAPKNSRLPGLCPPVPYLPSQGPRCSLPITARARRNGSTLDHESGRQHVEALRLALRRASVAQVLASRMRSASDRATASVLRRCARHVDHAVTQDASLSIGASAKAPGQVLSHLNERRTVTKIDHHKGVERDQAMAGCVLDHVRLSVCSGKVIVPTVQANRIGGSVEQKRSVTEQIGTAA